MFLVNMILFNFILFVAWCDVAMVRADEETIYSMLQLHCFKYWLSYNDYWLISDHYDQQQFFTLHDTVHNVWITLLNTRVSTIVQTSVINSYYCTIQASEWIEAFISAQKNAYLMHPLRPPQQRLSRLQPQPPPKLCCLTWMIPLRMQLMRLQVFWWVCV